MFSMMTNTLYSVRGGAKFFTNEYSLFLLVWFGVGVNFGYCNYGKELPMQMLSTVWLREPQYPVFALIGLFFLGYPLVARWKARQLARRRTARTRGRVVAQEVQHRGGAGMQVGNASVPTQHAVVLFEVDGRSCRVVAETGASWETLREGQGVDVVYNPDDPEDAGVDDVALQAVDQLLLWLIPLLGAGLFLWGLVNCLRQFG